MATRQETKSRNGNSDAKQGGQSGSETETAAALLKTLLEGYLEAASIQTDYQALCRTLPTVVGVAGEIMSRKEAGDKAMAEGTAAVQRILADAHEKAGRLSAAMSAQQAALDALLKDGKALNDLMRTGTKLPGLKSGDMPARTLVNAAMADPKVAYQINTMMGNIQAMVAREVERQVAALRAQAEQGIKQARPS